MSNDPWVELVCPSGHRTQHGLRRVLSHNNAWCSRCGASIVLTAEQLEEYRAAQELADATPAEEHGGLRSVGKN